MESKETTEYQENQRTRTTDGLLGNLPFFLEMCGQLTHRIPLYPKCSRSGFVVMAAYT